MKVDCLTPARTPGPRTLALLLALFLALGVSACESKSEDSGGKEESAGEAEEKPEGQPAAGDEGTAGAQEPATDEGAADDGAADEGATDEGATTDAGEPHPGLLDPAKATEEAPAQYTVTFDTTKGPFTVQVDRKLSPRGADRLYNLVKVGHFDDLAVFRVVPGFVAQFGMHGDPEVNQVWSQATIDDDPVATTNARGTLVFATAGPNTRSNQFFVNTADNAMLDGKGFSPFGTVTTTRVSSIRCVTGSPSSPSSKSPSSLNGGVPTWNCGWFTEPTSSQ